MADTNGAEIKAEPETDPDAGAAAAGAEQPEVKDVKTETVKQEESPIKKEEESCAADAKVTLEKQEMDVSNTIKEEDTGPPTDLEKKIIRQIEYYFGDINLARDKFLQEEIKKDDGWVPLETMVKFNRLKTLSMDYGVISTALKKSDSALMEVSADNDSIRRNPHQPLPEDSEERRTMLAKRTVYAKGFPLDTKIDEVLEFFQKIGDTDNITMRRDNKKLFKGSVFAVFNTVELAKKFMDEEKMKFGEHELIRHMKEDYFKMKKEEHQNFKNEGQKKKQEDREKREKEIEEKMMSRMTKGAILKVTGLPEKLDREELKEFFGKFGTVAWADFDHGDVEAKLRFSEEGSAKTAWEKAVEAGTDGKVTLKDSSLEASVLEGEEEIQHWKDMFQSQRDHHSNRRRGGGRGGGGRGGGRFGGRGGGRNRRPEGKRKVFDDDGAPPSKQTKADD